MIKQVAILFFLGLTFVNSQTSNDQNIFNLAEAFERGGEYERAMQFYEELLNRNQNKYEYFEGTIRCLSFLKRFDEAISRAEKWMEKNPEDISMHSQIGGLFVRSGNIIKADSVWKVILTKKNISAFNFSVVAQAQLKERLPDKAIETFVEARKTLNNQNLFRLDVAQLYFYTLNYTQAAKEYLSYLKEVPQQLELIESRFSQFTNKPNGIKLALSVLEEDLSVKNNNSKIPEKRLYLWLLLEAKKYREASLIAKQLNTEVKSDGEELFNFANKVFGEKAFDISLELYGEIIKTYPNFNKLPEAKYYYFQSMEKLLSDESYQIKDSTLSFKNVISGYRNILKDYPLHANTVNTAAELAKIIYEVEGNTEDALQLTDSVSYGVFINAEKIKLKKFSAKLLISLGDLKKAEVTYNEILKTQNLTDEDKNSVVYLLAKLKYYEGSFDSSISLLKSISENYSLDEANDALKLQFFILENYRNKNMLLQYSKGELLLEQKKYSEALGYFSLISKETSPLADDASLQLGMIYLRMKNYNEALKSFQNFIEKFTTSILIENAYFLIGNIFEFKLQEKENAIIKYQQLLEKFPNSIYADECRKKIRILRGDAI